MAVNVEFKLSESAEKELHYLAEKCGELEATLKQFNAALDRAIDAGVVIKPPENKPVIDTVLAAAIADELLKIGADDLPDTAYRLAVQYRPESVYPINQAAGYSRSGLIHNIRKVINRLNEKTN